MASYSLLKITSRLLKEASEWANPSLDFATMMDDIAKLQLPRSAFVSAFQRFSRRTSICSTKRNDLVLK